jgi:hypothetical protein
MQEKINEQDPYVVKGLAHMGYQGREFEDVVH